MEDQNKGVSRFAVDLSEPAAVGRLKVRPVNGVWAYVINSVTQVTKKDAQGNDQIRILVGMTIRTSQGNVDYTEGFTVPKGLPYFRGLVENVIKPDGKRTDTSKLRPGVPIDWSAALKGCKGVCEISDSRDPQYARFSALTPDTKTTKIEGEAKAEVKGAQGGEVTRSEKLDDQPRQAAAQQPARQAAPAPAPVIDPADDDIPF